MNFGTYPTGWHIEGDLPNQVAVSTRFHCMQKKTLCDKAGGVQTQGSHTTARVYYWRDKDKTTD